eukprot:TRINITY_DN2333_c0_g3_i1.p1 TRINITY_DN2333_c0_g3~~TRINITY_DN2333_c0_g3_i1.p1  ORF type:complete len:415 (-),score=63.09 TRINITY_DN2333_c0_g3_i1:60-1304(-)
MKTLKLDGTVGSTVAESLVRSDDVKQVDGGGGSSSVTQSRPARVKPQLSPTPSCPEEKPSIFALDLGVAEVIPLLANNLLLADWVAWANLQGIRRWMGTKFFKKGSEKLYVPPKGSKQKVMWLANHRSWGDFYLDHVLTGCQGAYLSRMLVIAGLPFIGLTGALLDWVWFFRIASFKGKNGRVDVDKYNAFLDNKIKNTPWNGVLLYPEATRNLTDVSLPLKTGTIKYAYARNMPIQIIMSKNKERVMSEQTNQSAYNVHVPVRYSEVVFPTNFASENQFVDHVQELWYELWSDVFELPPVSYKASHPATAQQVTNEGLQTIALEATNIPTNNTDKSDSASAMKQRSTIHNTANSDTTHSDNPPTYSKAVPYEPPFVHKPGMNNSAVQVRFILALVLFYMIVYYLFSYLTSFLF